MIDQLLEKLRIDRFLLEKEVFLSMQIDNFIEDECYRYFFW